MTNFEYECILYWNQRQYKCSVSWVLKTNTSRFWSSIGAYKYRVFTSAMEADLDHQELDQYVCYQAPNIITTDKQDV